MATPALQLENVSKSYGGIAALREVSLTLERGKSLALVGVNGAGKTTLLKCLLDFCGTDSGSIRIFGVDHARPEARRPLSYLPERFVPPYYLTGLEFLNYVLALQNHACRADRVERTLDALDLDRSVLLRPARTLSKGMTQKLGLTACLLACRELLVLDEPMSGLDPKARALAKRLIADWRSQGHALLFTTHSLADLEDLCDDVAILHGGTLLFSGAPAQLLARYDSNQVEQAFLACIEAPRESG